MWKRWNNYNGAGGPSIGHPALIETTVDEGYLETIPEVDSVKSKRSSLSTTIPDLPFRAMLPVQRIQQQHREPAWSQPSPTIPDYYAPTNYNSRGDQYPDISPPSSPRKSNPDLSNEATPISPIDSEGAFTSHLHSMVYTNRSRIPQRIVSDKATKHNQETREKQETKWDVYSGEPTKDESGLPATVRPGVPLLEHQYPQLKERTKQILAGLRERELANKPAWGKEPPPVSAPDHTHVLHKEPWKGQSGRTALVDPVQDNPTARTGPLQQYQRNISSKQQPDSYQRAESPSHNLQSKGSQESIKPVAPLKIVTKSRNPSSQSSQESQSPPFYDSIQSAPVENHNSKSLQSPFASPAPVRGPEAFEPLSSTRTDSPPYEAAPDTPRTPTPPASYDNLTPIKVQQMPHDQDVSRFSWTTYSTSMTESPSNLARIMHEDSPPPLPPIPQLHIKKRPVSEAFVDGLNIRRDARPSQGSIVSRKPVGNKARPSSGVVSTTLSLSKTLPQIPPELEARDKITHLEAQLDALAMRRHNTTRILRDLKESLKKNAIVYDLWKRREVGEKITNHEMELQNIANEEHDIGLLLHRAQRKRDIEDNYETPTGLWIRRVTS